MNSIKNLSSILLAFALLTLVSCGGNSGTTSSEATTETMEAEDKSGPEYTSAYICPMHCKGSGSAEAGKCPVCKMDYVANEGEHNHDDHKGHNH